MSARRLRAPDRAGSPWSEVGEDFDSWTWQIKNRETDVGRLFDLTAEERPGATAEFPCAVTPYYALLAENQADCPIRRQFVPRIEEVEPGCGLRDPLGEEEREVTPGLIHRYPDRVLLLVTNQCSVYCRFCTRRRIVGRGGALTKAQLEEACRYIEQKKEICEVILSGGDALMLGDAQLDHLLMRLRKIDHLDVIRVATRMPVTCPMRVTDSLVSVLAKHQPIYLITHFNHPRECTTAALAACARLVNSGIPVYNQTVLLRGVNDCLETIATLNRLLVLMRVSPYYLHQCDMAEGIEHFRTPLDVGLSIIDGLRGHTSGLVVPQFCVDAPGGLGKVTLQPDWVVERDGRSTMFRTYTGSTAEYLDPK